MMDEDDNDGSQLDGGVSDTEEQAEEEAAFVNEQNVLKESYNQAKCCVDYTIRVQLPGRRMSDAWKFFPLVVLKPERRLDLLGFDPAAHKRITESDAVYACKTCLDMEERSLSECLKSTGKDNHLGNFNKHLKKAHNVSISATQRGGCAVKKQKVQAGPVQPRHIQFTTVAQNGKCSPTPSSVTGTFPAAGAASTGAASNFFLDHQKAGSASTLSGLHQRIFTFTNNANISVRAVTTNANTDFLDIIQYAVHHANTLKKVAPNLYVMGPKKFADTRESKYHDFIAGVVQYVTEARKMYLEVFKKEVAFVVFCHDIWDSKAKEVLGVVIKFYNIYRRQWVSVAIGLVYTTDKKSLPTAEQSAVVLARCGIEPKDIFRAVNDTTNSALMTGRMMAGVDGTCVMHEVDLVIKHALGVVKRRKRGVGVVDSFPDCEAFRKKVKKCLSYLMDKKSKSRYAKYEIMMKTSGRRAVKLFMPNSTRVAGTYLMYQSAVKNRWNLRFYWEQMEQKSDFLENAEWILVAQLEAVLYPIAQLSKLVQTDMKGSNAYSFLHVYAVFVQYCVQQTWYVASVGLGDTVDDDKRWHGGAKFGPRKKTGDPLVTPIPSMTTITYQRMRKDQLLDISLKLIDRIASEMISYSANVSESMLVSMACNPLTATLGMSELAMLVRVLKKNSTNEDHKKCALDYRTKSKAALVKMIKDKCSEMETIKDVVVGTDPDAVNDNQDMFDEMRDDASSETGDVDVVTAEVDRFFDHRIQWSQYILKTTANELLAHSIGKNTKEWQKNIMMIAKVFDVMKWWEDVGKEDFPHIYLMACLNLAVPDSNGDTERMFSAATWMDDKLKKRQSDATFEMKVLLYWNRNFLKRVRIDMDESSKEVAKNATRLLIKEAEERGVAAKVAREKSKDVRMEAKAAKVALKAAKDAEKDLGDVAVDDSDSFEEGSVCSSEDFVSDEDSTDSDDDEDEDEEESDDEQPQRGVI
jgi:hypothetical protein